MTTTPYCTIADIRQDLVSDESADDNDLLGLIRQVSARIDRKFWSFADSFFAPTIATRDVPVFPDKIISWNRTLGINFPLMSVSSVTVNSLALVVGTGVRLYPPLNRTPYFMLQLINQNYSWYALAYQCSGCGGAQQQFVTIAGTWGWNSDPSNMWLAVDAITTAGINSSVTSFTVADVDGTNPYGITPRISAGNMLQIDTEWMLVISTVTGTNTVNVIRGWNGSTAAAHLVGATVSVYQVEDNIRRATIRQVGLQYARQGAYNGRNVSDAASAEFPSDTLQEFNGLLQMFSNLG